MASSLFKSQSNAPVGGPATEVPQPQHGGVYELVNGALQVLEGGPPKDVPVAPPPAPAAAADTSSQLPGADHE